MGKESLLDTYNITFCCRKPCFVSSLISFVVPIIADNPLLTRFIWKAIFIALTHTNHCLQFTCCSCINVLFRYYFSNNLYLTSTESDIFFSFNCYKNCFAVKKINE